MEAVREIDRPSPSLPGRRIPLGRTGGQERQWAGGSFGEELGAVSLEASSGERTSFLHDRRIPGTTSKIDHIAVAPSGVWVIDAKNSVGGVRIEDPVHGDSKLMIKGRDRTELVDGLDDRVAAVRAALSRRSIVVPVHGAICFAETDLPLLRALTFRGYPLLWQKPMATKLRADGPMSDSQIAELARVLAAALPSAYPARSRKSPRSGATATSA